MTFRVTRRFRGAIAGIALVAAVAPAAMAQEISDSHLKAARAAIVALHATNSYDRILPAAAEQIKTRLISANVDLEAEISKVVDEQAFALAPRRADLEAEAARIYAAAFTEDELNDITNFYTTDTGKKLLQSLPIAAREVNNAAQIWGRGIERDLLESVTKTLNESGLRPLPPANADGGDQGAGNGATQN